MSLQNFLRSLRSARLCWNICRRETIVGFGVTSVGFFVDDMVVEGAVDADIVVVVVVVVVDVVVLVVVVVVEAIFSVASLSL